MHALRMPIARARPWLDRAGLQEIAVRRNEKNHRDVDIDLRVSLNGEHGSYDLTQQYKLR